MERFELKRNAFFLAIEYVVDGAVSAWEAGQVNVTGSAVAGQIDVPDFIILVNRITDVD